MTVGKVVKSITKKGKEADKKEADKKTKSDTNIHTRTRKEKIKDFVKGVGLTPKQKKARDFMEGGLLKVTGIADLSKAPKKVGNIARKIVGGIIKKAHAKPKSDLNSPGDRRGYPHE